MMVLALRMWDQPHYSHIWCFPVLAHGRKCPVFWATITTGSILGTVCRRTTGHLGSLEGKADSHPQGPELCPCYEPHLLQAGPQASD